MPNPDERKQLEILMDTLIQVVLDAGFLSMDLTFEISPGGCTIKMDGQILYNNAEDIPWVS